MITELLTLQNQLRIFHWQTDSYAQHKALGKTYSELDELIDSFVEEFMGQYARVISKDGFAIKLENLKGNIPAFIDKYVEYLTDELPKKIDAKDTNLLNIRDEMLGSLQKLKYLLTLK